MTRSRSITEFFSLLRRRRSKELKKLKAGIKTGTIKPMHYNTAEKISYLQLSGTSNQGTIHVSYHDLVKVFGEPNSPISLDKKVTVEWTLSLKEDGKREVLVAVYEWKQSKHYAKHTGYEETDGLNPEDITTWEVGGKDAMAVYALVNYLHGKNIRSVVIRILHPLSGKKMHE